MRTTEAFFSAATLRSIAAEAAAIFLAFWAIWLTFKVFGYSSSAEPPPSPMVEGWARDYPDEANHYTIFAPKIPEQVEFAGMELPIWNYDVRESLDRELLAIMFWHSNTILFFKRASKYFPIIEPILAENGIPEDFKYLAVAESGLTNAVSPAGAKGFWQFMKATATQYGLEVNDAVDERNHLEKSTRAACRYLKDSYRTYQDWGLVAASYNAGQGYVSQQMREQGEQNYFDLALYTETARYLYRITAIKLVMSDPREYGFYIEPDDLYRHIAVEAVTVDSTISSLADFASERGTNYKILKDLNPWLLGSSLPNASRKSYQLLLPKGNSRDLRNP